MSRYMSRTEYKRRVRRKDSYHLVASRNRLPADPEDQEEDMLFRYLLSTVPRTKQEVKIHQAKRLLLQELARSGGDVTLSSVVKALEDLIQLADPIDVRKPSSSSAVNAHSNATKQPSVEGMWIEISKPKFHGCLGMNAKGDFEYSLGRMSFDMFSPTSLLCSIQGSFNPVHEVCVQDIARSPQSHHVPEKLLAQLQNNDLEGTVLRSYDIVTAFTVEADDSASQQDGQTNSSRRLPIEGLLTTYGYVLSHPDKANRLSIWFTDGSLEVVDSRNEMAWRDIFARGTTLEDDGKMSYHLPKPEGGGGTYVDVLFMDETLRIVRASTELIYVFSRVPCFPDE